MRDVGRRYGFRKVKKNKVDRRIENSHYDVPKQNHQILWTLIVGFITVGLLVSRVFDSSGVSGSPSRTILNTISTSQIQMEKSEPPATIDAEKRISQDTDTK